MNDPVLNIAIFIIWWWVALFAMLPIGVRSLDEAGLNASGHDQGAPAAHNLKQKALWAAGAALVLWALTYAFVTLDPLHIRP